MSSKLRRPILDRPIGKTKGSQVSLSAFAYLFSEILQQSMKKASGTKDLENILSNYGQLIGPKLLELQAIRDKSKREISFLKVNLQNCFKHFMPLLVFK
jgi:hypothetical protein